MIVYSLKRWVKIYNTNIYFGKEGTHKSCVIVSSGALRTGTRLLLTLLDRHVYLFEEHSLRQWDNRPSSGSRYRLRERKLRLP